MPESIKNSESKMVIPDLGPRQIRDGCPVTENTLRDLLSKHDIKSTKIRLALGALLFDGHDKHVSVEDVIEMARAAQIKTSIASVYNTLNQFSNSGLLRRVQVEAGKMFFDTNLTDHHHFYYEDEGRLEDIPASVIEVANLPTIPPQHHVSALSVLIRLSSKV